MERRGIAGSSRPDGSDALSRADVTVLDRSLPVERIITHPPIAVFEVLSPEDTLSRLKRKLEDYRTMGIQQIWVIDPEDSNFSRYEDSQLNRRDTFSDPARRITFEMSSIKRSTDPNVTLITKPTVA